MVHSTFTIQCTWWIPVIPNDWSLSLIYNMLPVYINTWLTADSCGIILTTVNAFQILSELWDETIWCVLVVLSPKILYVLRLDYNTVQSHKDFCLEVYLAVVYLNVTTFMFFFYFYICLSEWCIKLLISINSTYISTIFHENILKCFTLMVFRLLSCVYVIKFIFMYVCFFSSYWLSWIFNLLCMIKAYVFKIKTTMNLIWSVNYRFFFLTYSGKGFILMPTYHVFTVQWATEKKQHARASTVRTTHLWK